MLTQLPTLKSRLAIPAADPQYDDLLSNAIKALSARFDKETNRTLARTENATFEFNPSHMELSPPCYPIETVTKFELKTSETTGWQEISPAPDYLIRSSCIISLPSPLSTINSHLSTSRLTYTGGYVLPGTAPSPGQTPLPDDLEQAAVEQVAYWFQNREHLGLKNLLAHRCRLQPVRRPGPPRPRPGHPVSVPSLDIMKNSRFTFHVSRITHQLRVAALEISPHHVDTADLGSDAALAQRIHHPVMEQPAAQVHDLDVGMFQLPHLPLG